MKYFLELTPAQQDKILDALIDGPLFKDMKTGLRQLLSEKCYVFDVSLKMHTLGITESAR